MLDDSETRGSELTLIFPSNPAESTLAFTKKPSTDSANYNELIAVDHWQIRAGGIRAKMTRSGSDGPKWHLRQTADRRQSQIVSQGGTKAIKQAKAVTREGDGQGRRNRWL